jgi:serine protease Do
MHVPVDTYRETWERLAAGDAWGGTFLDGRAGGTYMGLDMNPKAGNTRITEVYPDSPALRAGLKKGDVITSLGGTKVETFAQLLITLNKHRAGESLTVEVTRDGESISVAMKLGRRPPMEKP